MPAAIRTRRLRLGLAAAALVTLAAVLATPALGHRVPAHAAAAQQCRERRLGPRSASNPLGLASDPGANPLSGARFFVDGPAHGSAAAAIATLLGLDPARLPASESWSSFRASVDHGRLHRWLARRPGLAYRVRNLEKIASQPDAQRVSAYSRGGGRGGVFLQTEKLLCKNSAADPYTVPILTTYFLHPAAGQCPSPGALRAAIPTFQRRVNEFARAIDRRAVVLLLETDSIGASHCIETLGSLPTWESMLSYEISTLTQLPHAVIYTEAGYSDSNSPAYTAKVLNAIGITKIRGFYTNDTHLQWTSNEVRWATQVSRLTHGAHFIVNTAQNGHGPLLSRHPGAQGNERLCNPPGRGLGPAPTTQTGIPLADAWLWTSPPGNSSGCGGGPPGGVFWTARAVGLASRANGRLGPDLPGRPY